MIISTGLRNHLLVTGSLEVRPGCGGSSASTSVPFLRIRRRGPGRSDLV